MQASDKRKVAEARIPSHPETSGRDGDLRNPAWLRLRERGRRCIEHDRREPSPCCLSIPISPPVVCALASSIWHGVDVGVIISDTFGRAWRLGQTNIAIGVAGHRRLHRLPRHHRHAGKRSERHSHLHCGRACGSGRACDEKDDGDMRGPRTGQPASSRCRLRSLDRASPSGRSLPVTERPAGSSNRLDDHGKKAVSFQDAIGARRSVRAFTDDPVPARRHRTRSVPGRTGSRPPSLEPVAVRPCRGIR